MGPARRSRNGVGLSVLITLLGVASSIATTWGAYGTRIEKVEDDARTLKEENKQLRNLLSELNTKLAVNQQQNADMIRRLERIEVKIDRDRQ
jgi:hypothetical protein